MFAGQWIAPSHPSNNTNSFLAPHDARLDEFHKSPREAPSSNNETFITRPGFARQISSLKAKSIVLIMDSCLQRGQKFQRAFAKFRVQSRDFEAEGRTRGIMIVQKSDIYGSVRKKNRHPHQKKSTSWQHELKHGALSYCIFEYVNAVRKETDETGTAGYHVNSML